MKQGYIRSSLFENIILSHDYESFKKLKHLEKFVCKSLSVQF